MALDIAKRILGEAELWKRGGGRESSRSQKWRSTKKVPADVVIRELVAWWLAKEHLIERARVEARRAAYEAVGVGLGIAPPPDIASVAP